MDEKVESNPQRSKLENFLSGCLAFVILICVPIIIGLILSFPTDSGSTDHFLSLNRTRQDALEKNWMHYLNHAKPDWSAIIGTNFELTLCPFNSSDTWHHDTSPEEAGFICGYITVPLNHDQPEGETIQIPVAIWPSYEENTKGDPLFITHGGPGGSALEYIPSYFYPDKTDWGRDLVIIDQRGTRFAEPSLICPEVTDSIKGSLDSNDRGAYEYLDFLRYCRARLAGQEINLAAFTTPQIARDIEVVRKILGYDQINFYGVSYGTHVGQYLAEYYPNSIRSLILDGVAPIPLDYLNRSVSVRTRIIDEIVSNCSQDPLCAKYYPDLSERVSDLINRLDQHPETVRLGAKRFFYPIELDGEYFINYYFSMAYMDQNYAVLPYIIKEAEHNRFNSFKAWIDWRISELSLESLAYLSVICSEHQPFTLAAEGNENIDYPLIAWENKGQEQLSQTCQQLGIVHTSDALDKLSDTTLPALFLSGHFDPITPPAYAEITLKSFPNGQHILDPLGSHGVAFNDDCLDSIMAEFLDDPYHQLDPECLADPARQKEIVPPNALSSLIIRNEIYFWFYILSSLMISLNIIRYLSWGGAWVWRKIRQRRRQLTKTEKLLRLRYELANWVFALTTLGLGFGLHHYDTLIQGLSEYRRAYAIPVDARSVLFIPFLLVCLGPIFILAGIKTWKNNPAVLERVYLLLETIFCLATIAIILMNDMFLIWLR